MKLLGIIGVLCLGLFVSAPVFAATVVYPSGSTSRCSNSMTIKTAINA